MLQCVSVPQEGPKGFTPGAHHRDGCAGSLPHLFVVL